MTARLEPTEPLMGELLLGSLEVAAVQIIELPRLVDGYDERDDGPELALKQLFERLRASLTAWTQALDHFRA